jgi:uncharacterized protein YbjT (DUF2867 family)
MATPTPPQRIALVAGATGLVGRALLPLLLAHAAYARVHVLLRRAASGIETHPRLQLHSVDFNHLGALPKVDDVYIALGTTIQVAGSQEAFRHVDFDYVVATAKAARDAGAQRLAIVSALGASAGSKVFYNRVKGEMQDAVMPLGYESVVFAQPSLLVGDRAALGQPVRRGEVWATRVLGPVMRLVPRSIRPIQAVDVAAALIDATLNPRPGKRVLRSGQMQGAHRH